MDRVANGFMDSGCFTSALLHVKIVDVFHTFARGSFNTLSFNIVL